MLQKIVNGIAIASGVVSITVVGVAGYVYIRKDAIIEDIKGKVMESVLPGGIGGIGGALGGAGLGGAGLGLPAPSNPMAAPTAPDSPTPPVGGGFGGVSPF